jgi:hypothetical protein
MQSFKFRRKLCCFDQDWDIKVSKRSFHSILQAECCARRFQHRNKRCKSQNAIFQISTETLLFRSGLRYYGIWTIFPPHSTRRTQCMSISVSKQSLQIAKRNVSNFDENSVNSIRIEILRRSKALYTLFYTPNVVHVDCSVKTIPADRKKQSFKFRRKLCYFDPDWDITAYNSSRHSILHAERIACQFRCRNNPCKSQNAILQISMKTLLFRSGLRYYGI